MNQWIKAVCPKCGCRVTCRRDTMIVNIYYPTTHDASGMPCDGSNIGFKATQESDGTFTLATHYWGR